MAKARAAAANSKSATVAQAARDQSSALDKRGIQCAFVTLHVGAGTFLPVKVDNTEGHRMHSEWGSISSETARELNAARAEGGRIVAVGTTSLRLLESATAEDGTIEVSAEDAEYCIRAGWTKLVEAPSVEDL